MFKAFASFWFFLRHIKRLEWTFPERVCATSRMEEYGPVSSLLLHFQVTHYLFYLEQVYAAPARLCLRSIDHSTCWTPALTFAISRTSTASKHAMNTHIFFYV